MNPVTISATIDAPRERVFEAVADLANRPAFFGQSLAEFRSETLRSVGVGAAARFRVDPPGGGQWIETVISELAPPWRLLERGRAGRAGRIPFFFAYELTEAAGLTELSLTVWSEPGRPLDRLREALGAERWWRRHGGRALRRLRDWIEADGPRIERVAIAGGNRQPTGIRSLA